MKIKFLLIFFLHTLSFLAFAEEENETTKEEIPQEIQENPTEEEIALNVPIQEELKKDLNTTQSPTYELNPTNLLTTTFPIQTTIGYNFEKAESKYFLQAEGCDTLNESKTRKINFLIKVPYFQIIDSTNKIAVTPDKFSINFIDPFLNISLGDNKYNLSSLTMKNLEKRGGFLNLNYKNKLSFSTLYLLPKPTDNKNSSDNLGLNFFIKPHKFIQLSSNFLFTKFEKENYSIPKNNYTYSLRSTFLINNKNKLDIEAATTNNLNKKNLAYLATFDYNNKYFSSLINWFYANPNFIGTSSDKKKLDSSIKYELNNFCANITHNYKNQNLEKLLSKKNAKRSRSSEINISYPIINPIKTTLGLKTKELKNLLNQDGYKLDTINLNISVPIKYYTINNTFEFGEYRSRLENYFLRTWSSYKLSLNYNPVDKTGISIYTKFGNLLYEDVFTRSYLAGTNLKIKTIKNLDLTFTYEYSTNLRKANYDLKDKKPKWNRNYFKQDLTYILPNDHKITISSHLNKPLNEKKEKAFLLTYTIPLQVPNINRTLHNIKNSLF